MELIIKNARASFPALFEPEHFQGNTANPAQYRVTALIEPGSEDDKAIKAAIKKAAADKWGAKADGMLKTIVQDGNKCCYIDGDRKTYNGYAGMMALTATRAAKDGAPLVVDRDKKPLTASDGKVYSGVDCVLKVDIYAQDNKWGKGIRCGLVVYQFKAHNASFGGAAPVTADGLEDLGTDEMEEAFEEVDF